MYKVQSVCIIPLCVALFLYLNEACYIHNEILREGKDKRVRRQDVPGRLKARREERGMDQDALARRSGVNKTTIARYETCRSTAPRRHRDAAGTHLRLFTHNRNPTIDNSHAYFREPRHTLSGPIGTGAQPSADPVRLSSLDPQQICQAVAATTQVRQTVRRFHNGSSAAKARYGSSK